jgi:hypothetical protein
MAKEKSGWVKASGWLFILGILIAIVAGVFYTTVDSSMVTGILAIIGFIIGLLGVLGVGSIERAEFRMFLLAVVALMAAGNAGNAFNNIAIIGGTLSIIVNYIGVLVVPAAVLIALKAIWKTGSTD